MVVALLAAFVAGLGGGSSAHAAGGALTALSPASVAADEGAARVVVSPDDRSVYATNRATTTVSQYSRNIETGKLTALSPATVEAGTSPEGVVVSPDGKYVYVANRYSNTVSQYSRDIETGKLTPLNPASVTAGEEPIGVTVSPDGKDLYAANSASATVSQYSRNIETGKLTALSPATVAAGTYVHGILVSPDGKNVYAANYGTGTVAQYSRDHETGRLTPLSPATVPAGVNPHDLSISPDGKNVYVANNSSPGTVSQFTRNIETGKLAPLSPATIEAGEYTEDTVVSPDGNNVYAPNEVTNNISQYSRNTETGALAALSPASIATDALPEGIAISTDGKSVYAANHGSGSVSQYARSVPPTVITSSASGVGQSAATVSGSVNPNGQATTYHFEYGTTTAYGAQAPAPPDPSAGSGSSAQPVSANLSGLAANTTYHFRISATNSGGTSKGSDETFKTLPNPPAVVTKAASSVVQTTATLNASVNPNGGEVTECKLEYGTAEFYELTKSYGSSAPCVPSPGSGSIPVAVSAALTGLTANTTYHFRISATNPGGTSKGSDETLKTLLSPPTVETKAASLVTPATATLNATVNPNGGEVTECKLEYGTTNAYGSSAPCVPSPGSGESAVAVSASVTGLSPNSTYHFRISATNAGGTSKGSDETFKTLPNPPAVVTEAASAVTQTTATLNAPVNPNGGEVSECKLEYGTTSAYEASAPCAPSPGSGSSPVAVSAAVTGLTANATYHFRIVATNAGGTSKGADRGLTTPPVTAPSPQAAVPGGGVLPSQESKAAPVPDAELTSTSLTVSPSGIISAKVTCPTVESSCKGTVVLHTLNPVSVGTADHQSKQRKAVLMLAGSSFTVAGGHVKAVTLHLSAKARALMARTHVLRVRATIAAHDPAGAVHTTKTIVTLRVLKATRRH